MKTRQSEQQGTDLPTGLGKPAERALAGAGYVRLEQFTRVSEAELLELHGMGPKALGRLREALEARGLSFADGKTSGKVSGKVSKDSYRYIASYESSDTSADTSAGDWRLVAKQEYSE